MKCCGNRHEACSDHRCAMVSASVHTRLTESGLLPACMQYAQ